MIKVTQDDKSQPHEFIWLIKVDHFLERSLLIICYSSMNRVRWDIYSFKQILERHNCIVLSILLHSMNRCGNIEVKCSIWIENTREINKRENKSLLVNQPRYFVHNLKDESGILTLFFVCWCDNDDDDDDVNMKCSKFFWQFSAWSHIDTNQTTGS